MKIEYGVGVPHSGTCWSPWQRNEDLFCRVAIVNLNIQEGLKIPMGINHNFVQRNG